MKLLASAALAIAVAFSAGMASAVPLTLTFDIGANDPNISGGPHGPYDWMESGARIAGFWAVDIGTPGAYWEQGHTHPSSARRNGGRTMAEAMHSWQNDLQGLEISLESGATFDLISLDYQVLELDRPNDPYFGRLPWSYSVDSPHIVTAETFDPTQVDFESQWTGHSVIDQRPWDTLTFAGLTNLTSIMIGQTAHSVLIDNIVLEVHTVNPIPEPSTGLLMAMGLAGLASVRRSSNR